MSKINSLKTWASKNKVLAGILLLLVSWFIVGFVSELSNPQVNIQETVFGSGAEGTTTEEEKQEAITRLTLNEVADLGTYTFSVLNFEENDVLTSKYGTPTQAKNGAKFITVELEVVNQTSSQFNYFPDETLRLLDTEGREFDTYEDTIGSVDNYLNVRKLGPGITETGFIVYEVPESTTGYALIGVDAAAEKFYSVANISPAL